MSSRRGIAEAAEAGALFAAAAVGDRAVALAAAGSGTQKPAGDDPRT